jgi:hypothetical protein
MATVRRSLLFVVALVTLATRPAGATFHLMQIEQVIGGVSGDVTAQAIQLRMRLSGQNFVTGVDLKAWDATGSNPVTLLTFPHDVTNSSFGARILIATLDNDADGNFSPPFPGPLPSTTLQALQFKFTAAAASSNNANDYQVTAGAATFVNNLGSSGVTPVRASTWGRLKTLYH